MRRLAIVILNWNGSSMMRQYLPSVIANSAGDVIVADNASTDDSVEMLRREFPDVRTIILDQNYGFAEGYNRALAALQGEYQYVLLLNSDVEIRQKDWDLVLTNYMDAHPECAACMPKLLNLRLLEADSQSQPQFEYAGCAGGFLDRYGYPFCRGRIFGTVEEDRGQYDTITPILWATGAAMLVRADDFFKAGGLDSKFFAHMEEIDLCWRLRIMGRQIVCIPQSTAYHLGGASLNYGNPRKTYLNFRNNLLMLYKNLPQSQLHKVLAIRFILDLVAMAQMLVTGQFRHAASVISATTAFYSIRGEWKAERKRIQSMRRSTTIPERRSFSILWQYYAKGRKTFDCLPL